MKKLILPAFAAMALLVSACHYGQNEAKETIERNEQYKTEKQDYSVNKAGERGKQNVSTEAAPADTAK
jgi:hypothetical protein